MDSRYEQSAILSAITSDLVMPGPVASPAGAHPPDHFRKLFEQSVMDQSKDYPPPVPVVTMVQNGEQIPFLTLKSFSLWQGKQKSKKTTVLALAVAAFISPTPTPAETRFEASSAGKVLFFDNEQGESYAARTMKLILRIAGVERSDRLFYCDLREFGPRDRFEIIRAGIEATPDVKLVVIDGLVDLLTDFMDAAEGHMTTADLLKLCSQYDIHVAGVLHQNKNDKNARAHIGTISSQKCEIEISTEVDNDDRAQSIVTCVNSRGVPFQEFAIRWDKGSLPCINQDWHKAAGDGARATKELLKAREIVESVLKPLQSMSHSDLVEQVERITARSTPTATRYVKSYLTWGIISKGDDGLYRLKV